MFRLSPYVLLGSMLHGRPYLRAQQNRTAVRPSTDTDKSSGMFQHSKYCSRACTLLADVWLLACSLAPTSECQTLAIHQACAQPVEVLHVCIMRHACAGLVHTYAAHPQALSCHRPQQRPKPHPRGQLLLVVWAFSAGAAATSFSTRGSHALSLTREDSTVELADISATVTSASLVS